MPCSVLTRAKRAFVTVLLTLASACGIALEVPRDSEDKLLLDACRRVARKVHPDKGGDKDRDRIRNPHALFVHERFLGTRPRNPTAV